MGRHTTRRLVAEDEAEAVLVDITRCEEVQVVDHKVVSTREGSKRAVASGMVSSKVPCRNDPPYPSGTEMRFESGATSIAIAPPGRSYAHSMPVNCT